VKYWLRSLIGLAICGASIVAVAWALYHLMRIGTCASGGPYVSARPCPSGTEGKILALAGGIVGALIGTGVYATRGRGAGGTVGLGVVMWSLLFLSMAGAALVAAYGPAYNDAPGTRTAAIILGIVFIPMGLIPLLALGGWRRGRSKLAATVGTPTPSPPPRPAPAPAAPAAPANPGSGAAERLRKLDELRDAGLITQSEFDDKKAEILKEL
jgi:hypothetical protein